MKDPLSSVMAVGDQGGRVCADIGSSHSTAGGNMYQVFKDKGLIFQETTLVMSLANSQQTTSKDFLSSVGLVLDVKNACWYFWDNPIHEYPLGEELDTPSIAEKMSSNTCQLREVEGEKLTSVQMEKLNLLLEKYQPGEYIFMASHPLCNISQ
ncbi:retrovirus-related Pol polyprotein from transposon 17.6, partial [Nephila pilipes]